MFGDLRKWRLLTCFTLIAFITGCGMDGGCDGGAMGPMGGMNGGDGGDGGDNGGGSETVPISQSLAPAADSLNADDAYHLLRRAALTGKPEDVQRAVNDGLTATIDRLMTRRDVPSDIMDLAESYEDDMPKRWLVELLEGPNPLHERMTMFWHDRFATSRRVVDGRDDPLAITHLEMLRENALGNYRLFLQELTLDPLMLVWLDGGDSPKDNPNENYTREFWELFTLGRDVLYTENDIKEGARAFTGTLLIRNDNDPLRPVFDIFNHDETDKNIFPSRAQPANYNFESIIDLTLAQPEAAEYVARNLFEYFVHPEPSERTVRELADQFVAADFEIAPIVRTLLMSEAFFSDEARYTHVATPVEHFLMFARTLDMHMESEDSQGFIFNRLSDDLRDAGQELLNPPGVEGWTEGEAWLEDQWVLNRVDALGRFMEFGPDRDADLPYHLLPPVNTWDDRSIRREMVLTMADIFHLDLTEDEIDIYIEVLDQNGFLAFHLEDTEDQPRHVREMIRLMAMDDRFIGF